LHEAGPPVQGVVHRFAERIRWQDATAAVIEFETGFDPGRNGNTFESSHTAFREQTPSLAP